MPVVPKISQDEFIQKIKEKYPDYKDVDNTELFNKLITKYPEYKGQIDFGIQKKNSNLSVGADGQLKQSVPSILPSPENNFGAIGLPSATDLAKGQQNVAE